MPTFCSQCAAPRAEDVCPIHGASSRPRDNLDAPTVGGAAGRRVALIDDEEAEPAPAALAPEPPPRALPPGYGGHRLPKATRKSGLVDPIQPLPTKKRATTRGFWGPVLFVGLIGGLGALVLWVNIRPKHLTVQDRLAQLLDVFGDAARQVKGETSHTAHDVAADRPHSGAAEPVDPSAHPPEKPGPLPAAPIAKPQDELAQLAAHTKVGVRACYQGADQRVPERLEVHLHLVHGKPKVRHPERLGHVRNCVASVVENAAPPKAHGTVHYVFE